MHSPAPKLDKVGVSEPEPHKKEPEKKPEEKKRGLFGKINDWLTVADKKKGSEGAGATKAVRPLISAS
jgi:hypothetical protein